MSGPAIFTGSSSYSTDLQNVISRAVAIASLPMTQLANDKTAVTRQSDELTTIERQVTAVRDSITAIGDALNSSFDTTVSDPSVVAVSAGPGAIEGNYSIKVSDAGAYSTMMTRSWVDPGGPPQPCTLSIGEKSYVVTAADNSAAAVATAINKRYGDKVHAVVVNVGASDTPDYRISLQSVGLTTDLLDLSDGAGLAAQQTAGRPAQYEVNGSGQTVSSSSRTVSIADGITLTLNQGSAAPVNVTITRSTSAVSDAVAKFVDSYNTAMTELDAQTGTGTGPLQGNLVVADLSRVLRGIATYAGSGAFSGLRDLGVELQQDGSLTQNQFQLMAADLKNSPGVTSFFQDFAETAGAALDALEDPSSGLIKTTETDFQSRLTDLTNSIADKQSQIDDLQQRLTDQMSAADAMLAAMEQQYSYMSNMFSAMQTAAEQYK